MSFDPITMLVAGTAVKAVGSLVQGQSQAASYAYNAQIAAQNAQIAQQQGVVAVEAQQRQAARSMGTAIANYGASGVQTDSGSPMDVLADAARMAELDKLTTQYNYALKAAGYQQQAQLDLMGEQTSNTSGVINALGSALQGGAIYSSNKGSTRIPIFGG